MPLAHAQRTVVLFGRVPSFPRNITDRVVTKLQGVALELNKHHGIVLLCNVKLLMTGKIGFITVFDAISSGRQSGQKIVFVRESDGK